MASSAAVLLYDANGNALANNLTGQYVSVRDRAAGTLYRRAAGVLAEMDSEGVDRDDLEVHGTKASATVVDRRPMTISGMAERGQNFAIWSPNGYALKKSRAYAGSALVYRLTTRPYALSNTSSTGSRKTFAMILHHRVSDAVASSQQDTLLKIRKVTVQCEAAPVATGSASVALDFIRTAANGITSTAIVPQVHLLTKNVGEIGAADLFSMHEAETLALTGLGSNDEFGSFGSGSPLSSRVFVVGNTALASTSTINPPPSINEVVLWNANGDENQMPSLGGGDHRGGFAVVADATLTGAASVVIKLFVRIEFSEEHPNG